jgi:hypothetical protein
MNGRRKKKQDNNNEPQAHHGLADKQNLAVFLNFYCRFGVFSTREPVSSVGVLALGEF